MNLNNKNGHLNDSVGTKSYDLIKKLGLLYQKVQKIKCNYGIKTLMDLFICEISDYIRIQ